MRQASLKIVRQENASSVFWPIYVPAYLNPTGKAGKMYFSTRAEAESKRWKLLAATRTESKITEQTLADAIPLATPGSAIIIIPQEARNLDTVRLVTDLRRSLGMNQSEFAATLGISKSSLTKWETGERRPDAAALKLLRILRDTPQLTTA